MKLRIRRRAKAGDIAGIRRDLGFDEDDVEHQFR